MPKNRIIIVLGFLIALLPFFGFPHIWESFFQVASGFSIVLLLIWSSVDKRLSLKAKAQKRQAHKLKQEELGAGEVPVNNAPIVEGENI